MNGGYSSAYELALKEAKSLGVEELTKRLSNYHSMPLVNKDNRRIEIAAKVSALEDELCRRGTPEEYILTRF